MPCEHKLCGNIQKVWLPYEVRGHIKGLKLHPYCLECGAVKNISSDRAKPLGYFMNILSHLPVTKVQIRLIAKDMEELGDFEDAFSISLFMQEQIFVNLVKWSQGVENPHAFKHEMNRTPWKSTECSKKPL